MSEVPPRARPLDPIPVELEGQQMVVLRDPLRFSEEVVIAPTIYFFLALCDGEKTLADIKLFFARQFRAILTDDEAHRIVAELDRHYLLETDRFRVHRDEAVRAYRAETVRSASHQGAAYPDDPAALRAQLDSYYTSPEGPGAPPAALPAGTRPIRSLIAPHISVHEGGPCFAWAYSRLVQSPPVETFVILGTGHAGIPGGFAATRKTFETPLGRLPVDTAFLDRLESNFGGDLCADEIHHRGEHVIEFQAIFLQHALAGRGGTDGVRIVPILCSYGPESVADGRHDDPLAAIVERFCAALRLTLSQTGRPVCVLCSADLAHVGWRYGDPVRITQPELDDLERADRAMLEIVRSGNAQGFVENLMQEHNRRRICGFPCIYAMLRALEPQNGELLRYAHSAMDDRNSTVSYASMVFYE